MMATVHGRNTQLIVNEFDLSSFFRGVNVSRSTDTNEDTTFGSDDKTYVTGLRDATVSLDGVFKADPATADAELAGALGSSSLPVVSVAPAGFALGAPVNMFQAVETAYNVDSPVADIVSCSAEFQASDEAPRGVSLHAIAEEIASDVETSVDQTAQSTDGGVGHLHVTDFGTTTSLDVTIQDSADDTIFVDLITFTQATAATVERVEVSGTVDQFVRSEWTIVGGTGVTFAVAWHRNP